MVNLEKQNCLPCEQLTIKSIIPEKQRTEFLKQLPGWKIAYGNRLRRVFVLADFLEAIKFVEQLAQICEQQNHHPRIYIYKYNRVRVDFSTFIIGRDLTINDFIMAARANELLGRVKG